MSTGQRHGNESVKTLRQLLPSSLIPWLVVLATACADAAPSRVAEDTRQSALEAEENISLLDMAAITLPSDIETALDGTIVVTNTRSHEVLLFSQDFRLLKSLGSEGEGPGELILPRTAQVVGEHLLVVEDSGRVSRFDLETSEFVDVLPLRLAGGRSVAISTSGWIYTANGSSQELVSYPIAGEGPTDRRPLDLVCEANRTSTAFRLLVATNRHGDVVISSRYPCGENVLLNYAPRGGRRPIRFVAPIGRSIPQPSRGGGLVNLLIDAVDCGDGRFCLLHGLVSNVASDPNYRFVVDVVSRSGFEDRIVLQGPRPSLMGYHEGRMLILSDDEDALSVYLKSP